ncbi:glucose sorbosone dehydrogenase [Primorskyibacter flagellatus]|uniref:Glucose sorbosone dehydrogenase n=1 Tax=Primorskyibacter flagellatus TaxID=1387277 RepID=A0A917A593_9RHOB|nr:PQQ-dependent sugar dehydrogenase [Primorskyibacter flagellatus]GGE25765.1 glucose sorbosone dehydrogenase [Primorskyibacter flagellatus]
MTRILAILALLAGFAPAAQALETSAGTLRVEQVASGFDTPWAIGFLPDQGFLVTEKRGRLWLVQEGEARQVTGLPDIHVEGQGGLLDVLVPRDFASTREIFLTHAIRQPQGSGTALSRGTLSSDGTRLENVETLFQMAPGTSGGRHYGSRLAEGPEGHLFMTIGERGDRPAAQDLSRHNGSVIRLNRDGTVPDDNPFVGETGAQPEVWSYGHRNPQGMAMDETGTIWVSEHGARGGDEVNRIDRGANYGWPVISYGRHYSGARIGEGTEKSGMAQPVHYWDPSIAPSGMAFYDGTVADWQGDAFVGSLKFDYISRLSGDPLQEVEQIKSPETARVRDVRIGPDGALWFVSEDRGAVFRIVE